MKPIRPFFTLLAITFVLFSFSNCGSGKTNTSTLAIEQNPPFNLINSYYQEWVAGTPEGGSGTNIHLRFETDNPEVQFLNVYFKDNQATLERKMTSAAAYVGYIKNVNTRPDVIMSNDPVQEAQNRPPKKLPLEMSNSDAAITYQYKDNTYVFVIKNIEGKEMLAYPSGNPKGDN